jgi:hypothetical protein
VLRLPLAKFTKFNRPIFKSRRWPFIDPAKEVSAAREAIALRITSRQQVIEEAGGDRDDVFLDNLSDESYAEEIGLTLQPRDTMPETNTVQMPEKDSTDGTGDDNDDDDIPKVGRPSAKSKTARIEIKQGDKETDELRKRIAELEARINATAPTPQITVNNYQPATTVQAPGVTVNIPEARATEIPAPIVNLTVERQEMPAQPAPIVNVVNQVPQAAPPVVNVTVPPVDATITITRDADGKIASAEIQ